MPDDMDERFAQHEDLLRRLTALVVRMDDRLEEQRAMNQRLEARLEEQRVFNARQLEINADVRTTLARLETLLARLLRPGGNGQDI